MRKISGIAAGLGLAMALTGIQVTSAAAQVIVNNVLSPFTSIQVGPGYRAYGPSSGWLNDERSHQRCYRRWDAYYGHWHMHCVRMNYGHEPYYPYGGRYGYDSHYAHGPHHGHEPSSGYGSYYQPYFESYYGSNVRHRSQ